MIKKIQGQKLRSLVYDEFGRRKMDPNYYKSLSLQEAKDYFNYVINAAIATDKEKQTKHYDAFNESIAKKIAFFYYYLGYEFEKKNDDNNYEKIKSESIENYIKHKNIDVEQYFVLLEAIDKQLEFEIKDCSSVNTFISTQGGYV